ncbi:ubiquitin carrier protein, putative [Trypanosoma brucei gambiense DAL972]|uniref:E2 ubiquitin-conjugating enzyme n=1 Tax=Trypanosoma brucei gambiense (strain MHOM/CI/86/DAL972) TaxID=679716 RepID=C9ZUL2_TRYB9|nr:ubiquitin carrier protein, putative [Trypanosoma brucei gambiense DAL972]CBH13100.1 ubiquitin carrier protein, putative [Trypanosoma brucei gambiense DAL972]|eukprot:XP_011775377.1 ubiquitin carrier protein, putative [Trypanosoma brucei gambiense DAL972]
MCRVCRSLITVVMPCPISRLSKELKEVQRDPDNDVVLKLVESNNLFSWEAVLDGPPDTPYEGGSFCLRLQIPRDYPMVPPVAWFVTKVFHPNVNFDTGAVCLDILKSRWSPAWTISSVCRAIISLLTEPDARSPFNCDAGNLLRAGDVMGYNSLARMYAITEAGAPPFNDGE